jgi:hypothetical protein
LACLALSGCSLFIGLEDTHPYDAGCDPMASDPLNCGACGRSCLGGECVIGTCAAVELATSEAYPTGLVVDPGANGGVYWTNDVGQGQPGGGVRAIAKDGSAISKLTLYAPAPSEYSLTGIAIDATYIYFTAQGYRDSVAGSVHRIQKDGSGHISIGTFQGPGPLVLDADHIYWANRDAADRVERAGRDLSTPTVLITSTGYVGDTVGLAVDPDPSGDVYWSYGSLAASGLGLERATKSGTGRITLDPTAGGWVAVDATTSTVFYFGNGGPNNRYSLLAIGRDGTCPGMPCPAVLATEQFPTNSIALDDHSVYWTTFQDAKVMAVDKDGSHLRVVADAPWCDGIAVDDVAVYFTEQSDGVTPNAATGKVLKVAK